MSYHRRNLLLLVAFITIALLVQCISFVIGADESQPSPTPSVIDVIQALPVAAPEASLAARAEMSIPADPGAIIIPEEAFNQALDESPFYRVDETIKVRAVDLVTIANDPGTLGILGEIQATDRPQSFHGTLFIVVRDPVAAPSGREIQSTDYYVAAVELSGTSPWLGTAVRFAANPGLSVSTGRCCGPATICVQDPSPPGPCDPRNSLCFSAAIGVTTVKPPTLTSREQNGLPPIKLGLFPDKTPGSVPGEPIGGIGKPEIFGACTKVLDKLCTQAKPFCVFGDIGFTRGEGGSADVSSGSPNCVVPSTAHTVYFHDVPKICKIISGWENLPPGCGGYCESCGGPPSQANGLPPGCDVAQYGPESNICKTPGQLEAQKLGNNQAMAGKVGCANPANCTGQICEPTGRGGMEICTSCNNGECQQSVQKPAIDPRADSEASSDDEDLVPCDEDHPCQRHVEFEELEITADAPTSPDSSPSPDETISPKDVAPPQGPGGEGEPPTLNQSSFLDKFEAALTDFFKPDKAVDPVLLGDGSFHIEQIDLLFDGPARTLEFRRTYNSRSRGRSTLGSNWTHNWDVRIQPLKTDTTPAWALPYCAGSEETTTCLLLHDGNGGVQLFFFDMQSRLFMPQAGSTDTIATTTNSGWALRRADGHTLYFNDQGYLVNDRDRFGSGFSITYERTPLFEMYDYYCNASALAARNETKYSRRCSVLAYLMDDATKPDSRDTPWQVAVTDYPLPNDITLAARLEYARQYFLYVMSLGPDVQSTFGERRLRPKSVVDNLDRTLTFSYYRAPLRSGSSGNAPSLPPAIYDFASTPQSELLETVNGPVGTTLRFSYSRPAKYPQALNEQFLVQVTRQDSPVAKDIQPASKRSIAYRYQWTGGPTPSYDSGTYADTVFTKFLAFYETFVGCSFQGVVVCAGQLTLPARAPGFPEDFALREKNAYISDVADNIIQVINSGASESETRYTLDPMSLAFDRVTAQRYGSSHAQQDMARIRADDPTDNWQTTLPKATLDYRSAGPTNTTDDLNDAFLPAEVRQRYPLETAPTPLPGNTITPVVGATSPGAKACNYTLMEERRKELPVYGPTLPYYNVQDNERHPNFGKLGIDTGPLYRSQLSCEQLAVAQLGDPTHNDLVSTLVPIETTPLTTDHVAIRIVGQRRVVAANVNRICSWTSLIDRDGDAHYYGLNYRGQVLVDAVQERSSEQFLFTEKLVNADGMAVEERRPTRGAQPWQAIDGSTTYTYEEIDSTGINGWNDWLPVFWSRRTNLLRVEEHAAGAGVVDELESFGGGSTTSVRRFQRFTYEPLFNQVKSIETGSIELRPAPTSLPPVPTDVPHTRLDYVFDYQELEPTEKALKPVLDHFKPWGFSWIEKKNPSGAYEYDYDAIKKWQLPLVFYEKDLNGDGKQGFGYGSQAFEQAQGVPILAVRRPANSSVDPQISTVVWAPHGVPAVIRGPDDATTVLEYYSIGSSGSAPEVLYGQNRTPTDEEVSVGFRGLLGRVRTRQFPSTYAAAYGPTDAPCAALAGPYQWLLPATCSAAPKAELEALGLPKETIDLILTSVTTGSSDRWLTSAFSYTEIGQPRYTWVENRTTHVVRDTDGRERVITDPLGNTIQHTYTVHGFPEKTVATDVNGQLFSETARQFDEEGQLTYTCAAQAASGCDQPGSLNPPAGVVQQYTYWPEGSLRTAVDPGGLVTEFEYNERQLPTGKRTQHPRFPSSPPRVVSYAYNTDGDLLAIHYGAAIGTSPGSLSETYEYDGLRRLKTMTNTRGYAWQAAYSNRDLLTGYKRDDVPYGLPSPTPPTWETILKYDNFGRLLRRIDNGTLTAQYTRTNGGLVYAFSATGQGVSSTTYDLLGRPVWTRDAAGNQVVSTIQATTNLASTAFIGTDGTGRRHTTASVGRLDALGLPIEQVRYGSGDEQRWTWVRDGAGFVVEERSPENYLTKYGRNLLGWPQSVSQQRTAGTPPEFDVSEFQYNKRGQIEKVTDPAKQITEIDYDPFGAVKGRRIPGQPKVSVTFSYDNLGRLDMERIGTAQIKHNYDGRGDPVSESLLELGIFYPIVERIFDDMGWVREARNFNPALSWLPAADRTVTQHLDYDALGRVKMDGLQVGLGASLGVFSNWSIIAGDMWQRKMGYPTGTQMTEWLETFDQGGRLARKERLAPGGSPLRTSFQWLGDLYVGRVQDQTGHPSPFREQREVDPFGRVLGWQYTAIDLNPNQGPVDPAEGAAYCGSQWNASECARPLLQIAALRDGMGRIASLKQNSGHPVFNGGALVPANHPKPWRGYIYNPMGQLDHLWEHAGVNSEVSPDGLVTHFVTAGDIRRLGASSDQWEYLREPAVGGTTEIRNVATGSQRWSLATPRGVGHQIQQLKIDGAMRTLTHDPVGRVQTDGAQTYLYDPRGQLAAVVMNGAVVESYAYDTIGRLIALFRGNQTRLAYSFVYDGDQMVAAYDTRNQPLWEATWGPGLDQLLEWRDHAGQTADHIPLVDHRNSVVATWSPQQGKITQTAEYSPEGRLQVRDANGQVVCQEEGAGQICTNPVALPFGFVSSWRSPVSGLMYMRNRWYSPELGQFISHDLLGYGDSYNLYAYVGFDPINGWDPWGLDTKSLAGAVTVGGGSAVGGLGRGIGGGGGGGVGGGRVPFQGYEPNPLPGVRTWPGIEPPAGPGWGARIWGALEGLASRLPKGAGPAAGFLTGFFLDIEGHSPGYENIPHYKCAQQVCSSGTEELFLPPVKPSLPIAEPEPGAPMSLPTPMAPEQVEPVTPQAPITEPEPNAAPLVAGKWSAGLLYKQRLGHNVYARKILGNPVREKGFRTPWSADFGLGTRKFDDYYRGIAYEINTTKWSKMSWEVLTRKLNQIGSDFAILTDPGLERPADFLGVVWVGPEALPEHGLGGQLKKALEKAGIPYVVVPW